MATWKDIPDFAGYQVSDDGRVRTHNKTTYTEKHGVRHWQDRILKPKNAPSTKRNQHRVNLWRDGKPYDFLIARLEAFTFFEKDINDHSLTVNHIDGNWRNNNLNNLELISLRENIQKGFKNGLYAKCQQPVVVIKKQTGERIMYHSMSEACRAIGADERYISGMFKHGRNGNDKYTFIKVEKESV